MQQDRRQSPPLQLTSLQSLPAVAIGPSSSEALLAALINSSTLTVFSFAGCCSSPAQAHGGELSLSSPLLEELRQRLATAVTHSLEVMRQEEVGGRATERLGRLVELSEALKREPATGDGRCLCSHCSQVTLRKVLESPFLPLWCLQSP